MVMTEANPMLVDTRAALKCQYCAFTSEHPRGVKIHEASCPVKRLVDKPTPPGPRAPEALGHSEIQDPAGKQVRTILSDLVERVRGTKLDSVTITHRGNAWSVHAEWIE